MRRAAAIMIGMCVLLAGCAASPDTTYTSDTVATLQTKVLSVTDAAASGDPESALARLDELQATLLDEFARGTVNQARFDSISAAIGLVRADLDLLIREQSSDDETDRAPSNSEKPEKPEKSEKDD
jgi:hypothetical protein